MKGFLMIDLSDLVRTGSLWLKYWNQKGATRDLQGVLQEEAGELDPLS